MKNLYNSDNILTVGNSVANVVGQDINAAAAALRSHLQSSNALIA